MEERKILKKIINIIFNKYTIAIYLFGILYFFIIYYSPFKHKSLETEIQSLQQELQETKDKISRVETMLYSLTIKDSLEAYAREQHLMHTEDETIYVVD